MKRIKKFASLMLAVVMVLSMSLTAFAESNYTITVDVNFKGQEYTLYKLFNATTTSDRQEATDKNSASEVTDGGIAYTLIDETDHALTKEFAVKKADGTEVTVKAGDWFEYTNATNKNIKVKDGVADTFVTTEEFRLFAEKYGQPIGNKLTAESNNDPKIKWTGLDEGYYFISTTTGTLVTVTSIAPNAIVKDKNTTPTVEKTVQEDSMLGTGAAGDGTNGYQKQNDQEIGGTVNFKTVISAKKGGSGYVLMDKMDSALTFDGVNSIRIYKGSVESGNLLESGTDYNAKIGGDYYKGANGSKEENKATFTVTFTQSYLDSITADTDLIVLYTAKINNNAVVNTAIPNYTTLQYGNNVRTEESETRTFVWGIDVLKYDGADTTKAKVLSGAEFVIYRTETVNDVTSIYYATVANGKLTGWTEADGTAEGEVVKKESAYFTGKGATVFATDDKGKINVSGLDEGTYKLLEVKAPNGYNKLSEAKEVKIDSTSDTATANTLESQISVDKATNGSLLMEVANNIGSLLPSTGGIGTTIFYVVGGILVVGAGILLVTKKRMGSNK